MANTYKLIEAKSISTAVNSIEFTSIPQTYTDLNILISARTNRNNHLDDLLIYLNGSTSNYSGRIIYTDSGSSIGSLNYSGPGFVTGNNATSGIFGNMSIYIPNYTSSNRKLISSDNATENNATSTGLGLSTNLWADTAAVTSLTIQANNNNFLQYTTFYLYGIKDS